MRMDWTGRWERKRRRKEKLGKELTEREGDKKQRRERERERKKTENLFYHLQRTTAGAIVPPTQKRRGEPPTEVTQQPQCKSPIKQRRARRVNRQSAMLEQTWLWDPRAPLRRGLTESGGPGGCQEPTSTHPSTQPRTPRTSNALMGKVHQPLAGECVCESICLFTL